MQGLPITSLFAAVYSILFILLTLQVVRQRAAARIPFGDGNDVKLRHYLCARSNFAEMVSIFLIVSALNELACMHANLLYLLNFVMLYGRISHAYGICVHELNRPDEQNVLRFRNVGTYASIAALAIAALLLVAFALR